jgi:hypothetical protein
MRADDQRTQARATDETQLIRCKAYLARAMTGRSGQLRDFDDYDGFYGTEEYKGLRSVLSIAIAQ